MRNGTLEIYSSEEDMELGAASDDFIYPDVHEFVEDQAMVMAMMANGPCKTFCYERLTVRLFLLYFFRTKNCIINSCWIYPQWLSKFSSWKENSNYTIYSTALLRKQHKKNVRIGISITVEK